MRSMPRKPTQKSSAGTHAHGGAHQLRIIGGRWRGTRLRFPPVEAIRPTPDRVRETVFNWLAPFIGGARCLDLFAGSGALGLEALSRGARETVFVERDPRVGEYLKETLARLNAAEGRVVVDDASRYLKAGHGPFDIVFMDPPFGAGLLTALCGELQATGVLSPEAYVYLESEAGAGEPLLPPNWTMHRTGYAGKVGYHLARTA